MDQDSLVKKIYEMIDKQMDNMNNLLNKTDDK